MKNLITVLCLILLTGTIASASTLRPAELVAHQKRQGQQFRSVTNLFTLQSASVRNHPEVSAEVSEGVLLSFNQTVAREIQNQAPNAMVLSLPIEGGNLIEVELVKVNLFAPGFTITNPENTAIDWEMGVYYRGVIQGMDGSIAAVSFLNGEVIGMFSGPRIGNYTLGALGNANPDRTHILYKDSNLRRSSSLECHTSDDGGGYTSEELLPSSPGSRNTPPTITVFYEVDFDIFTSEGAGTAAFITAEFNEVATLFANEDLTYLISEINIITAMGNQYATGTPAAMRTEFQGRYNGFNGDFAHLVSMKPSGGIAAGFSGLCNSNPDNSMCVSGIDLTFEVVPTYSFDILIQTHEMGHLNGSRHTHACVWNGNNTAIDGCSGQTEGTCSLPGVPTAGGTIMSYCHIQTVGTNLANGFGAQPGNVIRAAAAAADCLCPEDLTLTEDLTSGSCTEEAENSITASNTIFSGTSAIYSAGQRVLLNPGFEVVLGATFEANNVGCSGSLSAPSAGTSQGETAFEEATLVQSNPFPNSELTSFKVYPNPSQGAVYFELGIEKGGTAVELTVYNSTGQVVARPMDETSLSPGDHKVQFNGQSLPSGIYLYLLKINGSCTSGRILIER